MLRSLGGGVMGITLIALYNIRHSGETNLGLGQVLLILSLLLAGTYFYDLWVKRTRRS
ncbi:MAG: hypothetical protein ACQER4_02435 [Bacteroidota bacterium]